MGNGKFDLEGELRSSRARPRGEFAAELAGELRGASGRARQSRIGMWLAVAGLSIVAVASFGGVSYAYSHPSSAASAQYGGGTIVTTTTQETPSTSTTPETPSTSTEAVTTPEAPSTSTEAVPTQASVAPQSSVKPFTPPKVKPKNKVVHKAEAAAQTAVAPKVSTGQLPFTGLALWVPLAAGLVLIALGVVLRTRARRSRPTAH